MPRAVTHCPNCGQRVTPYAAGCAVCGADLEAARARRSARPHLELPRMGWAGASSGRVQWVNLLIAVLLCLALPFVGLFLALYWAARYNGEGNTVMAVLMLGAAALGVAALVAPVWFWSHILHI